MTVGSRGCYLWVFYIVTNMLTGNGSQNMFLLITSLIFNGFSIRKKFWKAETEGYSIG